MDAAFGKLLTEDELKAIYLRSRPTLEGAKNQRRMHFAPELVNQAQEMDECKSENV